MFNFIYFIDKQFWFHTNHKFLTPVKKIASGLFQIWIQNFQCSVSHLLSSKCVRVTWTRTYKYFLHNLGQCKLQPPECFDWLRKHQRQFYLWNSFIGLGPQHTSFLQRRWQFFMVNKFYSWGSWGQFYKQLKAVAKWALLLIKYVWCYRKQATLFCYRH